MVEAAKKDSRIMAYFICQTCQPHSTLDHESMGLGACLFPKCSCEKMVAGKPFTKKPYVVLSMEESLEVAARRGKEEPND